MGGPVGEEEVKKVGSCCVGVCRVGIGEEPPVGVSDQCGAKNVTSLRVRSGDGPRTVLRSPAGARS